MRIQKIEITNYKAFLGTHKINVGGRNLFIYGENGSGKSSLYYALKDFFQSSVETINLSGLENVFVAKNRQGQVSIKVTFKPNSQGDKRAQTYTWDRNGNSAKNKSDTSIPDGNKLKSFFTYKHLLSVYNHKKEDDIDLFGFLVQGVLKHFESPLADEAELGVLWGEVEDTIDKMVSGPRSRKKQADVDNAIDLFNGVFGALFDSNSEDNIMDEVNRILGYFEHNVRLNLRFTPVSVNADYKSLEKGKVHADLFFAEKKIQKPHLFLNEARLSAMAISIYLAMIKRHVKKIPCRVLFLDDIFIGLDIANRLPLLEILREEFADYQIFVTTYDKPWFEYARSILENQPNCNWKTMEFYAKSTKDSDIEVPVIFDNQDLIKKAEAHLSKCDYKAAAVYTRSAFEQAIQKYCEDSGKKVPFKRKLKNYNTEDFWLAIKADLKDETQEKLESFRKLVLNPFSHHNTENPEFRQEIEGAIQVINDIKKELAEKQKSKKCQRQHG